MADHSDARMLAQIRAMRDELAAVLEGQRRDRELVRSELAHMRAELRALGSEVTKLDERLFDRHGALLDIIRRLDALAPEVA